LTFDQLIIITTYKGREVLFDGDTARRFPPFMGTNGALSRFCHEYGAKEPVVKTLVMTDSNGKNIADVKNRVEFEVAAYFILDTVRKLPAKKNDNIYCVYSGGRRVMASYLMSSLILVGLENHHLYYISHSPTEVDKDPEFFYKPKSSRTIHLPGGSIESEDVELRETEIVFPKLGMKYLDLIRNDKTYGDIVAHIQDYISNEQKPIIEISQFPEKEPEIIGENSSLRTALEKIKLFAEAGLSPLLLYGETGTGKELCAKYYHYWYCVANNNKDMKIVIIHCGAIPETLLESELFGARKGSHSTALKDQIGRLAEAEGGIAFLDELNSTPLGVQAKLLRFLQDGTIQPLGGAGGADDKFPSKVNAKLVLALNEDAIKMIQDGRMREDFYYRIAKGRVNIPALRDRKEDIPALADYFVREACTKFGKPEVRLSGEVKEKLGTYDWPGNIRILEDYLERQVALSKEKETMTTLIDGPEEMIGSISAQKRATPESIFFTIAGDGYATMNYTQQVRSFEKWLLTMEYEQNDRNAARTAKAIKMPEATLKDKLNRLGIM